MRLLQLSAFFMFTSATTAATAVYQSSSAMEPHYCGIFFELADVQIKWDGGSTKYVSLNFLSFLSNYTKYHILENSCLALKHGNTSLLQFPNCSRSFSSIHCYFQHWWWYFQWEGHWVYLISSTSWLFSLFLLQWSSPTFSSLFILWYMNQTNLFRFYHMLILL